MRTEIYTLQQQVQQRNENLAVKEDEISALDEVAKARDDRLLRLVRRFGYDTLEAAEAAPVVSHKELSLKLEAVKAELREHVDLGIKHHEEVAKAMRSVRERDTKNDQLEQDLKASLEREGQWKKEVNRLEEVERFLKNRIVGLETAKTLPAISEKENWYVASSSSRLSPLNFCFLAFFTLYLHPPTLLLRHRRNPARRGALCPSLHRKALASSLVRTNVFLPSTSVCFLSTNRFCPRTHSFKTNMTT
jgi:hypothetical protein